MKNLSKWFGYPIYISKIKNFEEINKEIVPIIINNITPTNSVRKNYGFKIYRSSSN